ncbi:MAG: DNA/RNA non-specific endonuclease [Prevotella sp.]|nr:DNA/RNA non-specific endonuclease [Prevotella sp.]
MKSLLSHLCPVVMALALLAGCGDDDDRRQAGSDTGRQPASNVNANDISREPALQRLEFPRVKGGTSRVVIHSLDDRFGINYSVEWDTGKRSQRWSCYQMYADNRKATTKRYYGDPQYPFDPQLSAGEYFSYDPYYGSGYDHGHICPSADRLYSADANKQTFYLTNMQPQRNNFNAGIWEKMEGQLRKWLTDKSPRTDTLYVCKGGTIDATTLVPSPLRETLGSGLPVPRYFFMALLMKNASGYKALGFWAEHLDTDHSADPLADYVVNISELQARTGIDFFCNLPDDVENHVENLPLEQVKTAWGLR